MKKRILCFGDSNTWGAIPNTPERYGEHVRWTSVLQDTLGSNYIVIEEGYNGRTTVHDDPIEGKLSGLTYFKPCLESQLPLDLILIMLGTNDLKERFHVNPRDIADGLHRYAEVLQNAPIIGSKPEILIVSPILMSLSYQENPVLHDMFGENAVEKSLKFAEAYKDVANDIGAHYFNAAEHAAPSSKDGLHMEPESHERLGKALALKIRQIIG
ncbi:MAG: SGNH/GDSL hydrolase family protein [Lachnospiraceae bacterium]|nr:SGNH/GDSL hydrolase family protein [Lachnospiraceae bacterium]